MEEYLAIILSSRSIKENIFSAPAKENILLAKLLKKSSSLVNVELCKGRLFIVLEIGGEV